MILTVNDNNGIGLSISEDNINMRASDVVNIGTSDYDELINKPSINDVELVGDLSSSDIGVANEVHTHVVSDITNFPTLATVATSGNYNDLSNKPTIPVVPTDISAFYNDVGYITDAGVTSFNGSTGDVTYTPPVTSVNNKTGAVTLSASDVGALPDSYSAPVTSVNSKTGAVTLTASDVGAVSDVEVNGTSVLSGTVAEVTVPTKVSDLNNDSKFITSPNIPYLTCATAAATAAKTTTLVSGTFTEADLVAGAQVLVKFTYANGKANPTLSVNGTTAKTIYRYGTTAPSTSNNSSWNAGSVVLFTYDGSYWQMTGYLNTTYSEISEANITNGTGSSTGLASGRRIKKAVETFAPVTSVNSQTGAVTLTIPSTAGDVGAIASPASPTTGDFLVYDGAAWVAQSLSTWQGGNY